MINHKHLRCDELIYYTVIIQSAIEKNLLNIKNIWRNGWLFHAPYSHCTFVLKGAQTRQIRYNTRCYFNVRSKADMSQLSLPHGNDNYKVKTEKLKSKNGYAQK